MGSVRASVLLVIAGTVSLVLALGLRRGSGSGYHHPPDALAVWG